MAKLFVAVRRSSQRGKRYDRTGVQLIMLQCIQRTWPGSVLVGIVVADGANSVSKEAGIPFPTDSLSSDEIDLGCRSYCCVADCSSEQDSGNKAIVSNDSKECLV